MLSSTEDHSSAKRGPLPISEEMDTFEGSQEASQAAQMGVFSAYIDSAGNPDTSAL